ncbi:hypothetical protein HDU93_004131 [Gonapodya sp. JEL0774]|nr:hypothetical protein HDU93_004131 [Gonapodya sp. JEL0774]
MDPGSSSFEQLSSYIDILTNLYIAPFGEAVHPKTANMDLHVPVAVKQEGVEPVALLTTPVDRFAVEAPAPTSPASTVANTNHPGRRTSRYRPPVAAQAKPFVATSRKYLACTIASSLRTDDTISVELPLPAQLATFFGQFTDTLAAPRPAENFFAPRNVRAPARIHCRILPGESAKTRQAIQKQGLGGGDPGRPGKGKDSKEKGAGSGHIKRPMNSFLLYRTDYHDEVQEAYPDLRTTANTFEHVAKRARIIAKEVSREKQGIAGLA